MESIFLVSKHWVWFDETDMIYKVYFKGLSIMTDNTF